MTTPTTLNQGEGTALFIIDIQNDLATDPKTQIPHAERVKKAATQILASARQNMNKSDIIVFVQHEETPESGPLVRGSDPWKLVFEPTEGGLASGREVLVHKTTRDTFTSNPELAGLLKARGVTEVVACGIQSECCVESTCVGALDAGFRVTLLGGAHSTYDDLEGGKAGIEVEREVEGRVEERGGRIVGWGGVVGLWGGEVGGLSLGRLV